MSYIWTRGCRQGGEEDSSMGFFGNAIDPNNLRPLFDAWWSGVDLVQAVREDAGFVERVRRALLPLPFERETEFSGEVFPPIDALAVPALRGKRIAVVASGGSGALASMVGVQRAFEEAGLQPVAISAASAGVLFSLPWAFGIPADVVARYWMTLPRSGYVDPDWASLLRSMGHALGGWGGLLRGEALERSFRALLGNRTLGEASIPFSTAVWNVDLNRLEYIGTRETPQLPAAVAARVAISIPIFVEPVQIGEHLYGDGGVIDIFPVRPVVQRRPDLVLGVNCYLPTEFAGEDVSGWRSRNFAIMRASKQLRWSGMIALAREQARLAGDRLVLIQPVSHSEVRGAKFYDLFLNRTRWPDFMRSGRGSARAALLDADARERTSCARSQIAAVG
jgi:NTE family protein